MDDNERPDTAAKPGIVIRARQDADIPALTQIRNLPRVRWGTLRMPFESVAQVTKQLVSSGTDPDISLVACIGEAVVGEAGIMIQTSPRIAHAGRLGIMVHDDWQNHGVGTALFAALTDMADHWLGLRRLELSVNVDNAPAIALYKKFGFEIEATQLSDAFRDGAFVNNYVMGRLRGDLPPDISPYPVLPPPAAAAPFVLRAGESEDLAGMAALMAQPIVRHGTLRLPFEPVERNRALAEASNLGTRTIVAVSEGLVVGIGSLKPGANRRAHCGSVELLAVHESWQRRCVGSALMAALLDIADNWLNLQRLHLTVIADNHPAITIYQRFGFVIEGQKRADVFRAGGFADSKLMARVRGLAAIAGISHS